MASHAIELRAGWSSRHSGAMRSGAGTEPRILRRHRSALWRQSGTGTRPRRARASPDLAWAVQDGERLDALSRSIADAARVGG